MRIKLTLGVMFVLLLSLGLLSGCGGRSTQYAKSSGDQAVTPEQQLLLDAEAAWAQRGEKAQLDVALSKWEEYITLDPNNREVYVMLARGYYLLGNGHMTDEAEMLAAFDKGAAFGERGLSTNDGFFACVEGGAKDYKCLEHLTIEDAPTAYWTYATVGKWSATKGFTSIVKNKSKLKALADWVQATDPNFYYGAGDRILATYYAKAPAAFGGDLDLAKTHFEQSLAIEPNYLGTKVLMAQYYATKMQDKDLFRQLCEEVIAADPASLPDLIPEQKLEQGNAQRLLDEIDDLF
jgi:tetratricopeptide (TPR) repeat protein